MALARYEHQGAAPATTLANSMSAGDTSFQVASGTGYPTGAGGKLFVIAVDPGQPSEEKILCSARSGVTFTVSGGVAGRGYDNTSATAHTAPTAVVQHVFAATEADDANDHIYTTSRDDHTQYLRTDGTRAGTGTQNFGGAVVAGGIVTGTAFNATGITGSTGGRYVGSSSGAPSSGAHLAGDFTDDTAGLFWICTAGGTPGTWRSVGSPATYSAEAQMGTAQSIPDSTWTVIHWDTVNYDPGSHFTTGTTAKYTCPAAGRYLVVLTVGLLITTTAHSWQASVYQNGTWWLGSPNGSVVTSNTDSFNQVSVAVARVRAAANDTLQGAVIQDSGVSKVLVSQASTMTVDYLGGS